MPRNVDNEKNRKKPTAHKNDKIRNNKNSTHTHTSQQNKNEMEHGTGTETRQKIQTELTDARKFWAKPVRNRVTDYFEPLTIQQS